MLSGILSPQKTDQLWKVRGYADRIQTESGRHKVGLMERGVYRIFGAHNDPSGRREELGLYGGRFVDVVAKAVTMEGFYCRQGNPEVAKDCRHGYIERVELQRIDRASVVRESLPKVRRVHEDGELVDTLGRLLG